jgi:hypothetical protein
METKTTDERCPAMVKMLFGAAVVLTLLWLVLNGTCSCGTNYEPGPMMISDVGAGGVDTGEDYCKYLDNEVCVPPPFMQDMTSYDVGVEEDTPPSTGVDTQIGLDNVPAEDNVPEDDTGGQVIPPEDELWDTVDCGEAPPGSYYVVIAGDYSFRQEVTYMKAGCDTETTVDVVAGEPVCVLVHPADEPTIIAITLVCEEDSDCPDPELPTPQLYVRTDPATDILFYFGEDVDKDLHELFCNPYMFEGAEGLGPLYQDGFGFLIYTSWIGP